MSLLSTSSRTSSSPKSLKLKAKAMVSVNKFSAACTIASYSVVLSLPSLSQLPGVEKNSKQVQEKENLPNLVIRDPPIGVFGS